MAVQIQLRRGTAAQWTAANPILAEGEMGVETDTEQFKVGNGSSAWTSLSYATGVPVLSNSERNALTPYIGQVIYNTDTDELQFWNGSAWVGPNSIGSLSDVDLTGLSDGNFLQYNSSSGTWLAVPAPTSDPIPLIVALS